MNLKYFKTRAIGEKLPREHLLAEKIVGVVLDSVKSSDLASNVAVKIGAVESKTSQANNERGELHKNQKWSEKSANLESKKSTEAKKCPKKRAKNKCSPKSSKFIRQNWLSFEAFFRSRFVDPGGLSRRWIDIVSPSQTDQESSSHILSTIVSNEF